MSIDIRNRVIVTALSAVTSEKEIRSAMAFSSEHGFKAFLIDQATYSEMPEDVKSFKKINLSINFPYCGLSKDSVMQSLAVFSEDKNVSDFFICLDKFDVTRVNLTGIREFIKHVNTICDQNVSFGIEQSWINSNETLDKICSILEPYERHSLAISTYCKKPEKLKEILDFSKHLSSNGSCRYSYFGAIPEKKENIIDILSQGFAYCGIPKQHMSIVI